MSINRKQPFYLELAKQNIEGHSGLFKFGRSRVITSTESILWDGGGNYVFLDTAERLSIVSTSDLDVIDGIGARTMMVFGLDENKKEIFEVITLTGTTPVLTQQSFLRTNRGLILTSGTNDPINDANKGTISISGNDTAELQARIQINNGQTLMAITTVPAGKTGFVTGISLSAGQGKQCLFKAKFRNGPTNDYAFSVKFTIELYQAHFYGTLVIPLRVPEMTDVVITGQTTTGTIDASASFGMVLSSNSNRAT